MLLTYIKRDIRLSNFTKYYPNVYTNASPALEIWESPKGKHRRYW